MTPKSTTKKPARRGTTKKETAKKETRSRHGSRKDTTKRKTSSKRRPVRSRQTQAEDRSKRVVADLLDPWPITWLERDLGTDGVCEITERNDGAELTTGRRFAFQLKAVTPAGKRSPRSLRIKRRHLLSWVNSSEPFMLIGCELPRGPAWFVWIDFSFMVGLGAANPRWYDQETVTIRLPDSNRLGPSGLDEIRASVVAARPSHFMPVAPGKYLPLYRDTRKLCDDVVRLASRLGFMSVPATLDELNRQLRTALYVVAVTGPSRVGKSTLLNALAGREVSPVGVTPTTAVPLQVVPSGEDGATVYMLDGTKIPLPAEAAAIAEYATQAKNRENELGVLRVEIRVRNALLEPGISLLDMPGLEDPSPVMHEITTRALEAANAVLYVLDVSTAADGGFCLRSSDAAHLRRLASSADRVFVILNKADRLSSEHRAQVEEYLVGDLAQLHLADALPVPPLFVCAKAATEQESRRDEHLGGLIDTMWGFLLQRGGIGASRLKEVLREAAQGLGELQNLIKLRMSEFLRSDDLQRAIRTTELERDRLLADINGDAKVRRRVLRRNLRAGTKEVTSKLGSWLSSIPKDEPLPQKDEISSELVGWYWDLGRDQSAVLQAWATTRQHWLAREVAAAKSSSLEPGSTSAAELDIEIEPPALSDEATPGLTPGIVGAFLTGSIAAALGSLSAGLWAIAGFFAFLFFGAGAERAVAIEERVKSVEGHEKIVVKRLASDLVSWLEEQRRLQEKGVSSQLDGYAEDLRQQLTRSDKTLTPKQIQTLENAQISIATLERSAKKLMRRARELFS